MSDTERGFRRAFWGLLFVVLDVRLNGFDVLPDFVGYAFLAAGLGLLEGLSRQFDHARTLALILVVLSLVTLIELTGGSGPGSWGGAWFYYETAVSLLDTAMIWLLCGGIIEAARQRGLTDLASRAATRRALYVGLQIAALLVGLPARESPEIPAAVVIGLVIFALVLVCLLMGLMLRAARELGAPEDDDPAFLDEA